MMAKWSKTQRIIALRIIYMTMAVVQHICVRALASILLILSILVLFLVDFISCGTISILRMWFCKCRFFSSVFYSPWLFINKCYVVFFSLTNIECFKRSSLEFAQCAISRDSLANNWWAAFECDTLYCGLQSRRILWLQVWRHFWSELSKWYDRRHNYSHQSPQLK